MLVATHSVRLPRRQVLRLIDFWQCLFGTESFEHIACEEVLSSAGTIISWILSDSFSAMIL